MNVDNKQKLISFLRSIGLIKLVDSVLFRYSSWKNRKQNLLFKSNYPEIKLPPDYMMYESFQVDYNSYYEDSKESAKWIVDLVRKYKDLSKAIILDWGCGPGRLVRHLPMVVGGEASIVGCDYNESSIQWCKENIDGVSFSKNELAPPLNFDDDTFDFIYGISIFTHLSEEMHEKWMKELHRVLKPGGILLQTTHGASFKRKLTEQEKSVFDNNEIVIRANTKEGHRSFAAFQPEEYFRDLVKNFDVLEFLKGDVSLAKPQQDLWILKKKL